MQVSRIEFWKNEVATDLWKTPKSNGMAQKTSKALNGTFTEAHNDAMVFQLPMPS